ncbi:MAG: DEAD/DEAH box helicase, partial [Rhodospirillaceae bacterium]|nr:DEAD/DEAH box helicase [Rhodospirillaceae bacterium]
FVARDDVALARTREALRFFSPDLEIIDFPAWDCLPYDRVSPNAAIAAARIDALSNLLQPAAPAGRVVLTTVSALLQRVPPASAFKGAVQAIEVGGETDPDELAAFLVSSGYHSARTVVEPGEFARRGGLLDIFPAGSENPVRLDFFGDDVESIRTFDAATQRTIGNLDRLDLKPVSEVPMDEAAISRFRTGYRELFGAVTKDDPLYESISNGQRHLGMEHWLGLFYAKLETLLDYLPGAVVAFDHQSTEAMASRFELIDEYYQARKAVLDHARGSLNDGQPPYNPVPPDRLFLGAGELEKVLIKRRVVQFSPFDVPDGESSFSATFDAGGHLGREFSDARVNPKLNVFDVFAEHVTDLQKQGLTPIIGAYTQGSGERLQILMDEHDIQTRWVENIEHAREGVAATLTVAVLGLDRGFVDARAKIAVISEPDLLGERLSRPGKRKIRAENFIADVSVLSEGDLVVHVEHGIARFDGLMTIKAAGAAHDCLRLIYAGEDKLFLPVENIDAITRFGSEDAGANLDRLGGASWQARKASMKKRLRDMAQELIKIAATRELKTADPMHADIGAFDEFQSRFPYIETEDQANAIVDVVKDLAAGRPTDRLICGDVGFGKTEVALRAAFIAAMSGRQVALVVPTTLLARQHFRQFEERFRGFPVRVRQLSRLVTVKQSSETKEALKKGTVDIVIGTHALLAKDLGFRDLGLLIIDEEQHFGVKHKE